MKSVSPFLSAVYRKERTWNNFRPDVMKSGLQKYIRRGFVDKALYCAGELDLMKFTPDAAGGARAEGMRTNFLHRLMVIFVEDVGVGNLGLWPWLDTQMDRLWIARRSPMNERPVGLEESTISNIVRALCTSPKSRSCSHVRAATQVNDPTTVRLLAARQAEFPTVATIHAKWGRLGLGTDDFETVCEGFRKALREGCWTAMIWGDRIAEAATEVREYRKRKPVWKVFRILEEELPAEYARLHPLAMKWFQELDSLKEAKLCWMVLVLACIQRPALGACRGSEEGGTWARNRGGEVLEVDEFVEDRHTAKGRGKSLTEFALVGAHVENESPYVVQEMKAFYEAVKKAMDECGEKVNEVKAKEVKEVKAKEVKAKEAKDANYIEDTQPPTGYTNPLQIQLVTSRAKCRVWFATAPNGKQVVVKGPMKSAEVEAMLRTQVLKDLLDVPHANTYKEEEYGRVYIVSDNLVGDYTAFPTRLATTKLEKDVTILDAPLPAWEHSMLGDVECTRGMLAALAFRKVAGTNDSCCRNLVVCREESGEKGEKVVVHSVDDPAYEKETEYMWSKGLMKPKAAYEAALAANWEWMLDRLESWKERVEEGSFAAARIAELMKREGWKW